MLKWSRKASSRGEHLKRNEWKWGSKPLEDLTEGYSWKREQQTQMSLSRTGVAGLKSRRKPQWLDWISPEEEGGRQESKRWCMWGRGCYWVCWKLLTNLGKYVCHQGTQVFKGSVYLLDGELTMGGTDWTGRPSFILFCKSKMTATLPSPVNKGLSLSSPSLHIQTDL